MRTRMMAAAVMALALATGSANGAWAAPAPFTGSAGTGNTPMHAAGTTGARPAAVACPATGKRCAVMTAASATKAAAIGTAVAARAAAVGRRAAANDVTPIPWPDWCKQINAGIILDRTNACEIQAWVYQTFVTVNDGPPQLSGELDFAMVSYAYASTSSLTWEHEIVFVPTAGWGDALASAVNALANTDLNCVKTDDPFQTGPVTPLNSTSRAGIATYTSSESAVGDFGKCTSVWTLLLNTPGYPPASGTISMIPVRCDNAQPSGNTTPGCVFPQYPPALIYSQSSYPTLAQHVSEAQASGLPGATFDAPLHRTIDEQTQSNNRKLACGDAPSIAGRSCDEYPPASTLEGLAIGGDRRTFDGCGFDDLPIETGPTGVSVCMIDATDNNAQGGLHAAFFASQRVLDGDGFRILVGP